MASSSPRIVTAALTALGLLAGCGRTTASPVTLADLQGRSLQFALTDVDSLERDVAEGAHRFTVLFSSGDSCAELTGDITATFNGQPMNLVRGGVPDTGLGGRDVCDPPHATFDFDPETWAAEPTEDIRVILQDDTHSVLLVIQDGKAKRHFLAGSGTSSTIRAGQTQTYTWLPEGDVLQGPVEASLIPSNGGAAGVLPVEQDGNTARFLVPSSTVKGTYVLRLSGTATGQVLTCSGVAGCQGNFFHSEDAEVSVQ